MAESTPDPTLLPVEQCDRDALLPCPFCGGKPEYQWHAGKAGWIECGQCETVGPQASADNWDVAIAAWNTRLATQSSPRREILDAMRGCTGLSSGPDGHGTMRVVAQGFPPGDEMALNTLLARALSANDTQPRDERGL